MHLEIVTPPVSEVVTLAEAKLHCRVTDDSEDALITRAIISAREAVEHDTQTLIGAQGVRMVTDGPQTGPVYLRTPTTITTVEKWVNSAWTAITGHSLEDHYLLPPTTGWPSHEKLRITYAGGYTSANVPKTILNSILLKVGDQFDNREQSIVGTGAQELGFARHLSDRQIDYSLK